MGRRVPANVLKIVLLVVTLAILAAPPLFLVFGMNVLANNSEHSCGGG